MSENQPILVLYMPVVHSGYISFLQKYNNQPILILADEITQDFKPLRKDIRSLAADQILTVLKSLDLGSVVSVATKDQLATLNTSTQKIIMPDEEPMHEIAAQFLDKADVHFEPVFLRWDSKKALSKKALEEHASTTNDQTHQQFIQQAQQQAAKSVDQWRQIGAILVKDGEVTLTNRNRHLPDDYQPVYNGDPRGNFSKGMHIDLSTAQHAEAGIVAEAAKKGISMEGADLYVTTFPCPVCAKLIAETGLKTVYFGEGYSMVDGLKVLEEAGVKVVKVLDNG
jgi:dCMP deaminase